jgi:hypothetical protein
MGSSQSQKAGDKSTQIQAGGDATVINNHFGLSYADVKLAIAEERERIGQQVWDRAQEMLREAGVQPRPVPLKTIVPLLQCASLEEDGDHQERWAALLANASATGPAKVHNSFNEVLRQLSPREARFLDHLYDSAVEGWESSGGKNPYVPAIGFMFPVFTNEALFQQYLEATEIGGYVGWLVAISSALHSVDEMHAAFSVSIDNLLRLRLIDVEPLPEAPIEGESKNFTFAPDSGRPNSKWFLTPFGFEFISVCRPQNTAPGS